MTTTNRTADLMNDAQELQQTGGPEPSDADVSPRDWGQLARLLARDNDQAAVSLPGYHWYSVVQQRGWDQPTLDDTCGGMDPAGWPHGRVDLPPGPGTPAASPAQDPAPPSCSSPSVGVARERAQRPHHGPAEQSRGASPRR